MPLHLASERKARRRLRPATGVHTLHTTTKVFTCSRIAQLSFALSMDGRGHSLCGVTSATRLTIDRLELAWGPLSHFPSEPIGRLVSEKSGSFTHG